MNNNQIIKGIENIFDIEIRELEKTKFFLNEKVMVDVVNILNRCTGKVILCGMGKSGHIGKKISATMSSMGIPSFFLHPAEAQHGDLGVISENDILLIISNSGETAEICKILPNIKMMGILIIAMTSYEESTLAKYADVLIRLPIIEEATELQLAPTSSSTVELVVGDAIAAVISKMRKFKKEDFALYHPSGALGRKLTTKVSDLMYAEKSNPVIYEGESLKNAICEMSRTGLGAIAVISRLGKLVGLITDGDLKRYLEQERDIYNSKVEDVMTRKPITIQENILAVEALRIMEKRDRQLSVLPVIDKEKYSVGMLRIHDIIQAGIFL